jgi:hypothetical protein
MKIRKIKKTFSFNPIQSLINGTVKHWTLFGDPQIQYRRIK